MFFVLMRSISRAENGEACYSHRFFFRRVYSGSEYDAAMNPVNIIFNGGEEYFTTN